MIECRKAGRADRAAVVDVWREVFEDDPPEVERMLDGFVGYENQYLATYAGQVAAILSAVPCTGGGVQGAYFFALATRPSFRGKGIMACLMAYAEADCRHFGACFCCLIPAEASLFDYYVKHGYQNIYLRVLKMKPEGLQGDFLDECLEAATLQTLRERYGTCGCVSFSTQRLQMALEWAGRSGCGLAVGEGAYAVYLKKEGCLAVPELMAWDDAGAEALLSSLCRAFGHQNAVVSLLPEASLFAGQGVRQCSAQYKLLGDIPEGLSLYLRFGFDETFEKDYENVENFGL